MIMQFSFIATMIRRTRWYGYEVTWSS